MTPAEAGAMDGRTYTYNIVDGNNWEIGKGVYTSSGTTLARTTVLASRSGGTLGTSRIVLSGTAQVRLVDSSEDMDGVRGTRPVTGTSDTINNSDLGYVVTYSNAAAVAVSLAQASVSNLFIDGWAAWVQNLGVGTATITPATSTINGAATLVLAINMGAFIWSDGTNYHAYFIPVSKPLLAANNLSDVTAATARTNLGLGTAAVRGDTDFPRTDTAQSLTATQQNQVKANAGVPGTNVLINPDFRINQRVYVSAAALAVGTYGHDRWKAGTSGGDYSFTQLASSTQITIASGKSIIQVVEDKNVVGGSYVLSWTGTAQARVGINTNGPSGSYASSPIVFSGQNPGTPMAVEFNAGTLGAAKLEIGAVATPFVMPDFAQELSRCLRYYLKVGGEGTADVVLQGYAVAAAAVISQFITLPSAMRAAPSVAVAGSFTLINVSGVLYFPSKTSLGIQVAATAAGAVSWFGSATAWLTLSAEL
jgi:hypothetical protein